MNRQVQDLPDVMALARVVANEGANWPAIGLIARIGHAGHH